MNFIIANHNLERERYTVSFWEKNSNKRTPLENELKELSQCMSGQYRIQCGLAQQEHGIEHFKESN